MYQETQYRETASWQSLYCMHREQRELNLMFMFKQVISEAMYFTPSIQHVSLNWPRVVDKTLSS